MTVLFYVSALVAVLATLRVIMHTNPVHALLYLVVSLLAVAGVFVALGAPFAAALEVIIYAGAILVLFVFVVMMLNLGSETVAQEKQWLHPRVWIGPALLGLALLLPLLWALLDAPAGVGETQNTIAPKAVGMALYGPYLLAVELTGLLLLAALVVAFHLGRKDDSA